MRVVKHCSSNAEAYVVLALLESYGFSVRIEDSSPSAVLGETIGIQQEIRILVPKDQFQAAMDILASSPKLSKKEG